MGGHSYRCNLGNRRNDGRNTREHAMGRVTDCLFFVLPRVLLFRYTAKNMATTLWHLTTLITANFNLLVAHRPPTRKERGLTVIEPHRGASGGPAGAVIIPAHNEERVIARTLDGLLPLLSSPEVDVIVVCNGCTDGTPEVARRYAGVTVLETPVGSKPAAMNLGDAATERWPRLYLDADIEVEASAVEAVFRELSRPGAPLASRPSSVVDTRGAMFPVRSYYRARARIPERATRLWGAGLYAASEAGHARFAAFPDVTADDSWFDGLFAEGEKTIVETAPARVHAPRTTAALLQILGRHRRGYVELATTDPGSQGRGRALLGTIRCLPSALDAFCYAALAATARLRSLATVGVGTQQWETDASTRASAPVSPAPSATAGRPAHGTAAAR